MFNLNNRHGSLRTPQKDPNSLQQSGNCFNIQKLCILRTHCIDVFRMALTANSDYFAKEHTQLGGCHGDVMCFLWGRNWILRMLYRDHVRQHLNHWLIFFNSRWILLPIFISLSRSHWLQSWARLIHFIHKHLISLRSNLILSSKLRLNHPSGLSPSDIPSKNLYALLYESHTC